MYHTLSTCNNKFISFIQQMTTVFYFKIIQYAYMINNNNIIANSNKFTHHT